MEKASAARSCAAAELPVAGRRGVLYGARKRTGHPAAGSGARCPAQGRTRARISGGGLCPPGRPAARGAGSGEIAGAVSRQQSDLLQLSLRLLARGGPALPSDRPAAGRHSGVAFRLRRARKPTRSAARNCANWSPTRPGPASTRTAPISSSISTRPETPPIAAPTPTSPASSRSAATSFARSSRAISWTGWRAATFIATRPRRAVTRNTSTSRRRLSSSSRSPDHRRSANAPVSRRRSAVPIASLSAAFP